MSHANYYCLPALPPDRVSALRADKSAVMKSLFVITHALDHIFLDNVKH